MTAVTAFATSLHHSSKSNGAARHQHDRATLDQLPEARMVIELVRQGRAGHDQRPA